MSVQASDDWLTSSEIPDDPSKDEFYHEVNWGAIEGADRLTERQKAIIEIAAQPTREQKRQLRRKKEDAPSALGAAFDQGWNRTGLYTGQVGEFIGEATGIEALTELSREQIEEETEQIEEMQDFRTPREDIGWGSLDEVGSGISYYSEAFLETLPIMAAAGGATIAGVMAAPYLGITGLGVAALGATAGIASQVPYFFGADITRGKETGQLDYSKAFRAAIGQSMLAQMTHMVGLRLLPKIGKPATANLMRNIGKGGEGLFTRPVSRLKNIGTGAAFTGGVEGLTEAGQTALERWQAGLDLLSDEAIEEYTIAAIDGAVLGGVFGATAGAVGLDAGSMARKTEAENLRQKKAESIDARLAQELETLGDDAPVWKSEQVSREIYQEEFFADAEAYYEQEVAAGADPEQVKADIAAELDRVLLKEQDRGKGATPLQRDESVSIQEISTEKVAEFVASLGTDEVKTGRPNLEPQVEPIEVEPEVEPTPETYSDAEALAALKAAELEKERPGDIVQAYDATGKPYQAEVVDVSEAGTVAVINEAGDRVLLGQDLSALDVNASDPSYTIEGEGPGLAGLKGKEVSSLSDEQLEAVISNEEQFLDATNQSRGVNALTNTNAAKLEQRRRLDAAELDQELDAAELEQDPEVFDDDPAMRGTTQGELEALETRNKLGTERKALRDTFFGAYSEENLDVYDRNRGELRYDTPVPVTEILRTVARDETNPDLKNLATTLISRFDALENAGVEPPKVVAGGMDYEIELAGEQDTGQGVSAGRFFIAKNAIYLNTDQRVPEGLSFGTVLHEAVHGALLASVNIGAQAKNKNTELGKAYTELVDIQGVIQEHLNTALKPLDPYAVIEDGRKVYKNVPQELIDTLDPVERDIVKRANIFANEDETLAWALTNPRAKQYLEGIKIPKESPASMGGKIKNAWGAFVNWVRKTLKLPQNDTVLSKVLDISDRLLQADVEQVARGMPGFQERYKAQGTAGPEMRGTRDLLGFFRGKKSKPKVKPDSDLPPLPPSAYGKYTYPTVVKKPKRKIALAKVTQRAERGKIKDASQKAMAEKIFGVQVRNIEEGMEASNEVAEVFKPDESEVLTYLPTNDLKKVTSLLKKTEKEVLGGKNKNKKTPASAAWNYFKGYENPESALQGLAWGLGVGITNEAGAKFKRIERGSYFEESGDWRRVAGSIENIRKEFAQLAKTEYPADRLSPWEEAFFTGTGGENAGLFLTWVDANLSKTAAVNIKNMARIYGVRATRLDSGFSYSFERYDPSAPDIQFPVRSIDPNSPEGKQILADTNWGKIARGIKTAEVETARKKLLDEGVIQHIERERQVTREVEIDNIYNEEWELVAEQLDRGAITQQEADAEFARINVEKAGMKQDVEVVVAQEKFIAEVDNILRGNADSKPLTIEAARELDRLINPALVEVIKNRLKGKGKNKGQDALVVALEYLHRTTGNKDLRQVIQTFHDKFNSKRKVVKGKEKIFPPDYKLSLKLTDKDLTDVDDVPIASEYDPDTDTITINENYLNTRALLHEIAHALTWKAVKSGKLPAVKDLKKIYKDTKDILGDVYGTLNIEEFIAEALSNAAFRRRLAGINIKGEELNILQKFTNAVRRVLNAILKRTGFESRLTPTDTLSQVDQLLNEIVPPVTDRDSYLSGATSASMVEKIFAAVHKSGEKRNKIIESKKYQDWLMLKFGRSSATVQTYFSYIVQNQAFADMAERVGLKGMLQIDKFLMDLKSGTNRVQREIREISDFYDKWAKIGGVEGTKAFREIIYGELFGSTMHQVDPRLIRAEAIKKYGKGSKKFEIWEAQRASWNKLRTIVVDGKNGHDLYNEMNSYYYRKYVRLRELLTGRVSQLIRSYMGDTSKADPNLTRAEAEKEYGKDSGKFKVWEKQDAAIQKEIDRTKKEIIAPIFDKQPLEVYFPLTRAGQYGVSFKLHPDSAVAEQNPHLANTFEMEQTYEGAQIRIAELRKASEDAEKSWLETGRETTKQAFFRAIDLSSLSKVPIDTYKKDRQTDLYGPDPTITATVFKKVMDLKDKADTPSNPQEQTRKNKEQAELNLALSEIYIDLLPETSFAKQFQVREGTPGYIGDPLFALQTKGMALGLQIERRQIAPKIEAFQRKVAALEGPDMSGVTRSGKFLGNKKESQQAWESMRVVAERKLEDLRTPPDMNNFDWFASKANAYAFLYTIGFNVSSAAVNLSQIPMVIATKLAGTYGLGNSMLAMGKALKYIHVSESGFSIGVDNYFDYSPITNTFTIKTTAPRAYRKDLERLKPLIEGLQNRGLLTVSAIDQQYIRSEKKKVSLRQAGNFDTEGFLSQYAKRKDGTVRKSVLSNLGNLQDKIVAVSGVAFSGAEVISRQATLIATYLLELDKIQAAKSRKAQGTKLTDTDYKKATDEAVYVMQETNGASFRESAPPLTRKGLLAITMMYKTFGLQMYYLQLKQVFTAINTTFRSKKGASQAEVDEMRRQRKAALGFIMGNTAVGLFLSGVVGNPLYGAVQMIYDLMPEDEDEPAEYKTFNRYVREGLLSDALVRGLLAEGLGINAGDRMRLSGLLVPEDRFKRDISWKERAFRAIGGPAGSVLDKMVRAGVKAGDKEYLRAVEGALPTGFANVIKALGRYETEGARTRDNMIIRDDLTGGELAAQFFGFSPMKIVKTQEDVGERKYIERKVDKKRQDLIADYKMGYFHGDKERMIRARRNMIKFNKRHQKNFPGYRILEGTLGRSIISAKAIRRTGSADGIPLSRDMSEVLNRQDRLNSLSKPLGDEAREDVPLPQ